MAGKTVKTTKLKVGDTFYVNQQFPTGYATLGDLVKVISITRSHIRLEVLESNTGLPKGTIFNMIR